MSTKAQRAADAKAHGMMLHAASRAKSAQVVALAVAAQRPDMEIDYICADTSVVADPKLAGIERRVKRLELDRIATGIVEKFHVRRKHGQHK